MKLVKKIFGMRLPLQVQREALSHARQAAMLESEANTWPRETWERRSAK